MNRISRYILLALTCLLSLGAYSQTNLRRLGHAPSPDIRKDIPVNKSTTPHRTGRPIRSAAKKDTVYSYSTDKRHGWFEPQGILTGEQVRHRNQSIRFTGKNDKGHWTKMESVDAYGNYVPGGFDPYIAKISNEKDTLVNKDWVEKLQSSCIYEFIPDASGEDIIQERAYDKDYNLIYSYSRIPIGNNQYIGSYRDINGLPAEMRIDPGYKYGTLVLITEDENGRDKRVEYIDSQRRNKPNSDGAYAEMYEYNDAGDRITTYSVDSLGNRIRDNWGNCAVIATYDSRHLPVSSTYADENLQPMRIFAKESGNKTGTMRTIYEFDDNLRQNRLYYVDENGNRDVNVFGCHMIEFIFDSFGNVIEQRGYDKDGNPAAWDDVGTATSKVTYDDKGNALTYRYFDKSGNPNATPGSLSKVEIDYDSTGSEIAQRQWYIEDGVEKLYYEGEKKNTAFGREVRSQFYGGICKITRYDHKGREIFVAFYDSEGNYFNSDDTWSHSTTEYTELGNGRTKYTTLWYDIDGNLSQRPSLTVNRRVVLRDSTTREEIYMDYMNDRLVQTYANKYREGSWTSSQDQTDRNRFGVISRAGGTSNVRLYRADVKWSPFTGSAQYLVGKDEFGEPDYITVSGGLIYYYMRNSLNGSDYMTTENEIVKSTDYRLLRDRLPKAMTIEVVDSAAYALGLRDNDLILRYGDYFTDLNQPGENHQFMVDWTVRIVLDADKPKDMVVFRIEDADAGKFGLTTIHNLKGTPSELGFIPHVRYLTERQTERISGCIAAANLTTPSPKEKTQIVIADFPEMYRTERYWKYPSTIKDATILLGSYDATRGYKYDYRDDTYSDLDRMLYSFTNDNIKHDINLTYYFADKAGSIKELHSNNALNGLYLISGSISEDDYQALKPLYKETAARIDRSRAAARYVNPKDLEGYWIVADSDPSHPQYIYLDKDGAAAGVLPADFIVPAAQIPESVSPVFRSNKTFEGSWSVTDSLILVNCGENESKSNFKCVEILEPEGKLRYNADYFTADYGKYTTYYNSRMKPYGGFHGYLFIKSLAKNEMVVDDGCGNLMRLVRSKNKPLPVAQPTKDVTMDMLNGCWIYEEGPMTLMLTLMDENAALLNFIATLDKSRFDDKFAVTAQIAVPGIWNLDQGITTITFDPAAADFSCDLLNFTLSGQEKVETLNSLAESLKSQLDEILSGISNDNHITATLNEAGLLQLDGAFTLTRLPARKEVMEGRMEGNEGYLKEAGLSGQYIVLQWCDWDCYSGIGAFEAEFKKQIENEKHIILLPITTDENGNDSFSEPITLDVPPGRLGLRLLDNTTGTQYFYTRIRPWYLMAK